MNKTNNVAILILTGTAALTIAIGIGRFSYTPILPYMISELKLIALKFKSTRWSENKYRYILILSTVILLLLLGFEAVPIILILYLILSIINNQVK